MTNIVNFRPAEFVNIHGKPLGLSMKQLVLRDVPKAWCHHRQAKDAAAPSGLSDFYTVRVPEYAGEAPHDQAYIGSGATEEAAWRDAYFAIKQEPEA